MTTNTLFQRSTLRALGLAAGAGAIGLSMLLTAGASAESTTMRADVLRRPTASSSGTGFGSGAGGGGVGLSETTAVGELTGSGSVVVASVSGSTARVGTKSLALTV